MINSKGLVITHHLFLARNPSFLLFSEELFSDTRLSQQLTGGVHLHIENQSIKNNLFMENKPNFRNAQMNVNTVITKDYEDFRLRRRLENKPNSNPIQNQSKPKQTQSNPTCSELACTGIFCMQWLDSCP